MTFSKPCTELKNALKFSFMTQILLMLLTLTAAGGGIGQISTFAFVGFNTYIISVLIFRPNSPTKLDLFLIRAGFFPLIILSGYLANYIWNLQGY